MVALVFYIDYKKKDEARRLMNKLCETKNFAFVDLESKISVDDSYTSLIFAALKNLFFNEIPELKQNAVIDGNVLMEFLNKLDVFQSNFIQRSIDALGRFAINIDGRVSIEEDGDFVLYDSDKDFFVDLEKKIDPIIRKIESDLAYKFLTGIGEYGFYLGSSNTERPPEKVFVLQGGSGQKITYDEYADCVLKEFPDTENMENLAFVRSKHVLEIFAKKFVKKGQK